MVPLIYDPAAKHAFADLGLPVVTRETPARPLKHGTRHGGIVEAMATESRFPRPECSRWWCILVIFIGTFSFQLCGCKNKASMPILLVVPDGYRGPICLVIDKEKGLTVKPQNGKYVFQVEQDGILAIRDATPFDEWHQWDFAYQSGESIPHNHEGASDPDAVSLHFLGRGTCTLRRARKDLAEYLRGRECIEYFVGSDAEAKSYLDMLENAR